MGCRPDFASEMTIEDAATHHIEYEEDRELKEYKITDIDFDGEIGTVHNHEYKEEDEVWVEAMKNWEEYHKSLIEEVCGKTWFARDEDELCDEITDETGWLVKSHTCEVVKK